MKPARIEADAVRQAVSLLELLPPDANPRRVGRDAYKALCTFHEDTTPSMSVRLTSGGWRYRCFACGESGGVVDYFMSTRKVDFKTALRELGAGGDGMTRAPKKRRRPGFLILCSECPARADIDATDEVDLMVWQARRYGWHVEEHRSLCPACVEKRLSDPYRGGQQASFRRVA